MSGPGWRIAVGLLGLFALVGGSILVVGRTPSGAGPQRSVPTAPSGGTDDGSAPFQDGPSLFECMEVRGADRFSQTPAPRARAEIDRIADAVERLRDLAFERGFEVRFLSPERLAERAVRLSLKDYPRDVADAEERMLAALGVLPRGTDLRGLVGDLLESQVAGFYLPEQGRLFVPGAPDAPLGAFDRVILAHELEHAVADQTLDLPLDDPDPQAMDRNLAVLSVIEGDATLTMQRYAVVAVSAVDQLGMLGDPRLARSQEGLAGVPHFLVAQLTFPYESGLSFVCDLYGRGGWRAVNRAYRRPPESTAAVLFPDRYGSGEDPVTPPAPETPQGFEDVFHGTFGAAHLLWLFEAPGNDTANALEDPLARASEWAGGRIHVYARGKQSALALHLTERAGADDLCASMARWYDASFSDDSPGRPFADGALTFDGGRQEAVLSCAGNDVLLGIGPGDAVARELARSPS